MPRQQPVWADAAAWARHQRAAWDALPGWGFDRAYVAELAAENGLPRILAAMGIGRMLGRIAPWARAVAGSGAPLGCLPLAPEGRWLLLRLEPIPACRDLLALDDWSHAWRCPSLTRRGADLIDLGAWRWGCGEAKAAHRIARLCGAARPVP